MKLSHLGWLPFLDDAFRAYAAGGFVPARIAREERGQYLTFSELGELPAEVLGKLRFTAAGRGDFPAVGDWVALQPRPAPSRSTIRAVLPRRGTFSRKVAGAETAEQIVAANLTHVLLVSGLDGEFNLRRIERYLTLAWNSGASPVIVLNKADLAADVADCVARTAAISPGVPVLAVSAATGDGLDALRAVAQEGRTVAFLGSSGVGKSTLINVLLGEERLPVRAVRAGDSKGRHTTTRRELILLPGGGVLIDTPGMRELQLWGDEDGLSSAFADVESLAAACRFQDCEHRGEPDCAVHAAIVAGDLPAERLESYLRLKRELRYVASKSDARQRSNTKARWKSRSKDIKKHYRDGGKG